MIAPKIRAAALAACASLGLAACSTYDDGYGYGRPSYSVGIGYGGGSYYGDPYYDGWGRGYGAGYGWYDDFYYPGTGYYVFDRAGRRHAWNDRQRDYWRSRGGEWRGGDGRGGDGRSDGPRRPAWEGGDRGAHLTPEARQARREAWQARRGQGQQPGLAADPERAARREAWRAQRQQQSITAPSAPRMERGFRGGDGSGRPAWRGEGRRGRGN